MRAPVALSTASAGHMEERVQQKLKPTTYIKYAVAVCAVAKHRMKVSSYSSLKVGAAGCRLDAAGAAAAHKATLHLLQSSAATIYQDVWIISIKFPSSLRVEKVLNDDNFDILSQLRTEDSPLRCGESAICSLCSPRTNLTTAVYLSTQLWDLAG